MGDVEHRRIADDLTWPADLVKLRQESFRSLIRYSRIFVKSEIPASIVPELAAQDRSGEAGRTPLRFEADLTPFVGEHAATQTFESLLCDWVRREDQTPPRREGEDVRSHGLKLVSRHFKEFKPPVSEELSEWHGEELRVHDREVDIDEANQRHQVKAGTGAAIIWQRHRLNVDPQLTHRVPQLAQPFRVRSKSLTDRECVVIDPQEVAALGDRLPMKCRNDRHADLFQTAGQAGLLASSKLLAHAKEDSPAVGDDRGIVNEDGVGSVRLRLIVPKNLDSLSLQHVYERIVLRLRRWKVRWARISPFHWIGNGERAIGSLDEDLPQRTDHALTPVRLHRIP